MKFWLLFTALWLVGCQHNTRTDVVSPDYVAPTAVPDFSPWVIEKPPVLAASAQNQAPFYPQAPDGDWSLPWQEACEEATIILAHAAKTGRDLSIDDFRQDILNLVEWQKQAFGDYKHTTVAQTAQMIQAYFNYPTTYIVNDPTADEMRQILAEGGLIAAPFAGRMLGNPNYSNEGPYYHMVLIKGYDAYGFYTHDVGTKVGENYYYNESVLMNALHDYHPTDMKLGGRRILVIK